MEGPMFGFEGHRGTEQQQPPLLRRKWCVNFIWIIQFYTCFARYNYGKMLLSLLGASW